MTKKAQTKQNTSPDISISEHFEVLNEKIDSNTKSIKSLKKQVTLILTKMNNIEQLIKQSFGDNTPKQGQNQRLGNFSSDSSQDSDSDSFKKPKPHKTIKPSERVTKAINHTSDSEEEEDIEDPNNLRTIKTPDQPTNNKKTTKKKPTPTKAIFKPNIPKVTKSNNPPPSNKNHPNKPHKIPIIKRNKETSSDDDQEIDIQEELSNSIKEINSMQKSISKSIDYMNQTLVCENLNAMKCFKKIKWNTKKSDDDDENAIEPLTKDGCKYHIYAVDQKNKKYYFEITNSKVSNNDIVKKLDNENESFILAKVSDSMTNPKIFYYLFMNKDFYKIKCHQNQSIAKTIYEMKVQNKVIKSKGINYDYDNDDEESEEEEEENEEDKKKNEKSNVKQISKSIKIRTKKNGQYTNSTILRKIKFIRNENDDDDIDFQEELTKSRLRINKMENCISFNVGYMGEAYVFENLKSMDCFSDVVWNAKTSNPKNPAIFINDGKHYHISEDGGHYDIIAYDENDKKYYFEIKSTCYNKKSPRLSTEQKRLCNQINQSNESFIRCRVTNVLDTPKIDYQLIINENCFVIQTSKKKSFVEAIDEIKIKQKCYKKEEINNNNNDDDDFIDDSDEEEESDKKTEIDDFYSLSTKSIDKLLKQDSTKKFVHSDKNEFNGIINYLRDKSNGNLENEVIISSSSVISDEHQPQNVAIYDKDVSFFSNSYTKPFEWLKFDFLKRTVAPTCYTIKSIDGGEQYHHPKSWKIEGSNDNSNWIEIDVRSNVESLNGYRIVHTFKINKSSQKFRYIRMILSSPNWKNSRFLAIDSFEIYGTLFSL